ncbi:heavy metal translocating P-type ATPase [Streptomyces sp. NPDC047002]|uniref:heavy metal translocating P-type ATPase n=1 Tax=Streptomyces sp. NPDC047002 TaxID=3155475 RepID=UPI00345128D9
MTPTQAPPLPSAPAGRLAAPARRTRALALPEARWALAALLLFLAALPLDLAGAPAWAWGPLFVAVYATGGWEPGLAGLRALRERTLDVDLLMVVAALGAAAIGQVLDGALLIVIFATSGALEALATARTRDAVRGLLDLAPATATRLVAAPSGAVREERVPTGALAVGDTVLVRPGERIGADGHVADGASEADQATITGEPLPVAKRPGDEVFAGTLNGTGALRVTVGRDPADSVIARIVAMVEEASATKAPAQLFVEKVEQRYSLGMVAATLAVFLVPLAFGTPVTTALLRAMTFMIVASPCAVMLATMPPLLASIATAGRHGVLVKSALVMERLGQVDRVALDKTGTLTEGTPRVTDVRPVPGCGLGADELLALAAAAEHPSEHPLGRAVVAAAGERGLALPDVEDFASEPGVGVRARVGGRTVEVGAPARHPAARGPRSGAAPLVAEIEAGGRTAVLVRCDGRAVGVLGVADRLRGDAARTVAALAVLTGTGVTLLTGDNERAAARLAAEVGIDDVRAGLLPQQKAAAVGDEAARGARVLVVGDGVNDAPALATAHVGVAMGRAGSDLALETADAVIVRDELATVPAVVALSRRARRLVVQNLVIGGVFIAGLVAWDLAGRLPLPLGVLGHEGSTVVVGLNGLRLLRDAAWHRARPAAPLPAAREDGPGGRGRQARRAGSPV